jgi:transposase
MSLKSLPIPPVPEEIARVARAVFPRGNVFMQLRDTLGTMYTDEAFADLFPTHGQPAEARFPPGTDHDIPIHGALDGSPSC